MHLSTILLPLLATLTLSAKASPKAPKNAILLSTVKTLTLRSNAKTSHRRVSAIPQLTCKGPGCRHHTIEIMRCTNQGSDYESEDIQWSCVADVPDYFKLGSTDVICEGYANPDDSYVLKGSCGVEYRLLLTEKGEEKFGTPSFWKDESSGGFNFAGLLFMAAFFGVFGWILYSIYQAWLANNDPNAPRRPRPQGWGGNGGWGGGGGGGGGNGWNDPPPPYPGKPYGSGQQGFRPGFWSGAAGGAAAGYFAGSRGNNNRGNSMFGGGNNTGGGGWGSNTRPSASPSSSSGSSTRHETTGFGSTSRR